MKLRPSIHGFYLKNYVYFTLLSVLLFFASLYVLVRTLDYLLFFILLISSILLVAIGVFHSIINSKTTYIELNDDELVYDNGIFSHHRVSAPVSRITDTKIQRTFLDRLTGIADLLVNTSGTASVEIYANDFSFSELSSLHSELRSLIKKHDSKDNPNSVAKT